MAYFELDVISYIIYFFLILPVSLLLIVFFTFHLSDMYRRTRFINFLTKRRYGILKLIGKGRDARPFRINYGKEVVKLEGDKIFVLDPNRIYRENGLNTIYFNELDALVPLSLVGSPTSSDELPPKLKTFFDTHPEYEKLKGKKFYLNPVSFEKEKGKAYANPEHLKAIFQKQKALAEARTLFEERTFRIILFASLIMSAIAVVMVYQTYDTVLNTLTPKINGLETTVNSIKEILSIPVIR